MSKKTMKSIALILVVLFTITNVFTGLNIVSAAAATTSSATFVGIDTTTLGDWNGNGSDIAQKYGKDGYILFGYNSTPPETSTQHGVKYANDIVLKPSYVNLVDGYSYQMNEGTVIRVAAGYQNDNQNVLDAPLNSSLQKVRASAAFGDGDNTIPGHLGGIRTFRFELNDAQEHIFTIYTQGKINYRFFSITDLDGNELLPYQTGNDLVNPQEEISNVYLSFKVKGSFVFEYSKEWEDGLAGVFFDPTSVQSQASYLGYDTLTKGDWNGNGADVDQKYGKDGYILFGYNCTPPAIDVSDGVNYENDVFVKPAYVDLVTGYPYQMNDGTKIRVNPGYQDENTNVLDAPLGSSYQKVGASAAIGVDTPYGTSGGGKRLFTFKLNDDQEHIFTIYSLASMGNRYFGVKDLDGNDLIPLIKGETLFGQSITAAYVSFKVKGSFVFENGNEWQDGIAGVFFDTPEEVQAGDSWLIGNANTNGTVSLSWDLLSEEYDLVKIQRSKNADGPFRTISTIPAGTNSYTDSYNLFAGQTYYYQSVWVENSVESAPSNKVSVTIPQASTVMNPSAYLGLNTSVQGAWNGKFGSSGYLLVGQNGTRPPNWGYGGSVTDSEKYQIGVTDIYMQPSYVTNIAWAPGDFYSPSPDDHSGNSQVLDLPTNTVGKIKYKADIESKPEELLTIKVTVNDTDPHIFSTYTSTNWGNGATVELLDAAGNLVASSPYIPAGGTFGNGAYVSFMVQGSFQVRFTNTGGWACMSGFFFDEPSTTIGVPAGLSAVATETGRKINLTWTNAGEHNNVILERSTNNNNFSQIATFTGNETAYTDQNLTPEQTYYYRLRNVKDGKYGLSTNSVSATVPPSIATYLEITGVSATNVDIGDSVSVNVHLEKDEDGSAIDGGTVYLKLTGDHVGDGATLGQEIPELLGSGVTSGGGNATIVFNTQYVGSYGVAAYTLPDDSSTPPVNGTLSEPVSITINPVTVNVTPTVFKISDAVKPGALFSINGSDINDNGSLKVLIQKNADGTNTLVNASQVEIIQRDKEGRFVVAKLPDDAEPGVYNVWVVNEIGPSECYKLNIARPLYLSDYELYEGIEIELVGRNFKGSEFGTEDNIKVRLSNGSTVYPAIINPANTNPYKIAFTIGSGVPLGDYFVEASNDGGNNWVRPTSGQTLTVVNPGVNPDPLGLGVAWARDFNWEDRFDVTNYGATGNDTTNDTKAVQAAVNAAGENAGGGVVYFPNGSYYIDTITLPSRVVLLGETRDGAKLYYTKEGKLGVNFINSIDVATDGKAGIIELQGVANLSLLLAHPEDPNARPDSFMWLGERWADSYGNKTLRKANRIFVQNVKIDYPTDTIRTTQNGKHEGNSIPGVTGGRGIAMEFIGDERMLIQDNDFVGFHAVPFITGWNKYYLLRDNHFEYTFGYVVSLSSYFFAENNHVEAVHGELNTETHGIFGRNNAYMEGNYVKNVGAQDNSYNDGEALCVEVPNGYWNWGTVLKGTEDSITVSPKSMLTWPSMDFGDLSVLIVAGRGQGQLRKVKMPEGAYPVGQNIANFTMEVTQPFDVVPDYTSKFTLIAPNENATFYDNEIVDNAKGIWLFGNSVDGVIANNTSVDSEGIFIWSNGDSKAIVPDYYSRIVNNSVTGVSRRSGYGGIGFNTGRSGGRNYYFATDVYSTEIINNTVTGGSNSNAVGDTEAPTINGIYAWAAAESSSYDNIDGTRDAANTLILGNKLYQLDYGVQVSHSNYGTIVQDNKYSSTVATFLRDTHTLADQSVSGVNSTIGNNSIEMPAPIFVSAATSTDGMKVFVSFDKEMANLPAAPAGFTLTEGEASPLTITDVALNTGDAKIVELTLETPIVANVENVKVTYTAGTIKAEDGGVLESFTDKNVTNNSTSAEFSVENARFTNASGQEITDMPASGVINAEVTLRNNTNSVQQATLIVALYDAGGDIQNLSYLTRNVEGKDTESLTAGFRIPVPHEGYTVKVMVWDNFTNQHALSNVVTLQ